MKYKIALFQGDGVGPEIISQAEKVIEKACELDNFEIEWVNFPHCAEHYLEAREIIDLKTLLLLDKCSAIYCGPFGMPQADSFSSEKYILGPIKQHFGHFAFVKPVKLFPNVESLNGKTPQDINFTIIRESTEDFHAGICGSFKDGTPKHQFDIGGKTKLTITSDSKSEISFQAGILSAQGCMRIARFAQDYAKKKGIEKITSVDKLNSMSFYSQWRDAFSNLDVQVENELVDSAVINFIRQPEKYKIVAAPNLIGDILCDLSNTIHGGFSFSYGASINPSRPSMFMPLHGSAFKLKEKGIVNPAATILAGAMMLDNIGEEKSAGLIYKAVEAVFMEGNAKTQDLGGFTTTEEMGDAILDKFVELHE